LTGIEERLTRALYRINCPDPTELGEYQLQMISGDRAKFIKQHLAECPLCAREAAQLQDYLADLTADLEPGPLERVRHRLKVVVARLLDSASASGLSGPAALAPAYAGLRGAEEGPLVYQAGELQVVIQVHEDADRPGRQTIVGLVTGLSDPQGVMVHLWQAGQQLLTVPVDDLGNFEISDLAPAGYELILGGPETEIHIQDLPVGQG
jgi:hypothetical protein